jgi:glycosyltransferase involved in cell wall biosynthesis
MPEQHLMKIVILVGHFPPKHLAGTELATYRIAKYLADNGHEVHVITTMDEGLPRNSSENSLYVHRVWKRSGSWEIKRINVFLNLAYNTVYSPLLYYYNIHKLIEMIHPDVVHVQQIDMALNGYLSKINFKIPYIIYARGVDFSDINILYRPLFRVTLKKTDRFIVLTEAMKLKFKPYYTRDITVIPNGIVLDTPEKITKNQARKSLNLSDKSIFVITIGRLKDYKGTIYLVEAFRDIYHYNNKCHLLIIGGDQGEKEKILLRIKELGLCNNITLLGEVAPVSVGKYLMASDIFVLPSLREGFPNVLLEAMSAGLPVVATNIDGISEIVKDGENGFLINPGDAGDIADKVVAILSDDKLHRFMSANSVSGVQSYAMDIVIKKLESVYSDVIRAKK